MRVSARTLRYACECVRIRASASASSENVARICQFRLRKYQFLFHHISHLFTFIFFTFASILYVHPIHFYHGCIKISIGKKSVSLNDSKSRVRSFSFISTMKNMYAKISRRDRL